MHRRGKAYPRELRERVIAAVRSGSSRRAAARRFDIGISTAINWCAHDASSGPSLQKKACSRLSKSDLMLLQALLVESLSKQA